VKIKIAIILEATLGGIRKHVVDLLKGLNKEEFEIYFIYSLKRADVKFKQDLIELEKFIKLIEIPFSSSINTFSDVKTYLKLKKLLQKIKPDLVHMHGAKSGAIGRVVCKELGIKKIIYSSHGGSFHKFNNTLGFIYKYIELFLKKNTNYICVSKYSLEQIRKELNVSEENLNLIYNGIDLKDGHEETKKKDYFLRNNSKEDKLLVIYPALFLENKGHIEFLKLFKNGVKLNSNIKIVLLGDGPLKNKITLLIDIYNLKNNIYIEGFKSNIYDYYKSCDLVLLPSKAEAFGYVLLEAMYFKKPVFATNVGAIPEMIEDGINGELFNPNELYKIVSRLNSVTSKKEYLAELGENSMSILKEKFDLDKMVIKTENLYRKILEINKG